MSSTVAVPNFRPGINADAALKAAAGFWFVVLVVGQVIFAASTAMFYGMTALRGDVHAWNKHLAHGITAGDPVGNAALSAHIALAALLIMSGAIQFIPRVRRLAPRFHRWNGRVFMSTAVIATLAGLYLQIARGTPTGQVAEFGSVMLAFIILGSAFMALRYAMKRDIPVHRRWAFRLFLAVNAALFIRAGAAVTSILAVGLGGFDGSTIQGPMITILTFGQWAIPLAVLELYFWTQRSGGAAARLAMAAGLVAITLTFAAGVAAASVAIFVPHMREALDRRPSIAEAMADTIKARGADAAIAQYHALRALRPVTYNFDEIELNALGYELINTHHYAAAIAVLRLNTEAYPKSGNTWDSLGEAYMDDGDTALAIANYRTSLVVNPANRNAVVMLGKLGV